MVVHLIKSLVATKYKKQKTNTTATLKQLLMPTIEPFCSFALSAISHQK
jgi:amino acid permease